MNDSESPNSSAGPYSVLRNRDLVLYLCGRLIATFGHMMLVMAVGWELYERTHTTPHGALALAMVGLTQVIPMLLLTLPAGHVADHYSRQRIIVMMTLVVCASSLGLATVSAFHAPLVWIYVCLFMNGVARTFMWASSAAFLPLLVSRQDFPRAVNWNASAFNLSAIVGPVAGGALIAFTGNQNAAAVYTFNAAAALTCAILIGSIRSRQSGIVWEKMTFKGLFTGFNFVFANRIVLGILTLDMFAVLLGGAVALLPIYAKDILDVGPRGLGMLQSALPAGAVVCTFILAHRPPMQRAGRALLWAVTAFGIATILFGLSKWFWLSLLMLFASGAVDHVSVVVRHTLVQLLTPDEKRGRVSAVNNLFIGTSNELGGFRAGAVAQLFGPTLGNTVVMGAMVSVIAGGVGTILAVSAVALIWPEIRKYGRLDGSGSS